ncbi:hypothetical protein SpCBS45565_g00795 [Spizellomyces sp. 'palustris']|nr:hypothetical protein SpCBS45565_g00795 [Spizellomyces sp. 'palustris']
MLHELLLALSGHPGDVFVPDPPPPATPKTYRVATDFPFLHPAERTALDRLVHLGALYSVLRDFVDKTRKRVWTATLPSPQQIEGNAPVSPTGFYFFALCAAVDDVLDEYRQLIVEAEVKVLSSLDLDTNGGRTPISWLEHVFGRYKVILPHLRQLVETIEANPGNHGAALLSLLNARTKTGIPEVRGVVLRLLQGCMTVFYKQLITWMLYGKLHDPHGEFFVRNGGIDSRQKNSADDDFDLHLQADHTRWQSQFVLDAALVPDFVPPDVAETILFIGKAVVIIGESKRPEAALVKSLVSEHLNEVSALSKSHEFRSLAFENTISKIKRDVATILWDVVVMDEHLINHLKAFKACYLLGNGDLWMTFIEECAHLKLKAGARLSLVTAHELNSMFKKLVRKTASEEDMVLYMEHFRFRMPKSTSCQDLTLSRNYTEELLGVPFTLDYIVKWPLDLVFTLSDITNYNTILAFLLLLKGTHMRLQRVCSSISQSFRAVSSGNRKRNLLDEEDTAEVPREIWQVRGVMMFFLDCLWSYIQMDILESNYHILMEVVKKKERSEDGTGADINDASSHSRPDFEDIRKAHTAHLQAVLQGCFLDPVMNRLIGGTVREALTLCEQFCGLVDRILSAGSWNESGGDGVLVQVRALREVGHGLFPLSVR